MQLQNTIIVLIGFAGTGKFTIGRELCERTGAKLIDNHLINNPVFKVLNADGITPLLRSLGQGEERPSNRLRLDPRAVAAGSQLRVYD